MTDRNNPTPEELIAMLIEVAEARGGSAWWDGEEVQVLFGGVKVRLTVKYEGTDLRLLVDRGLGPLADLS